MSRIITLLALTGLRASEMRTLFRDGRDTWIADLLGMSVHTVQTTRQTMGVEPFDQGGSNEERLEERVEFDRRWGWVKQAVSQGVRVT